MNRQYVRAIEDVVIAVIPLVVVLLATKPALRQAVKMRAFHMSKEFCQANADFWQQLATSSAQAYNTARL